MFLDFLHKKQFTDLHSFESSEIVTDFSICALNVKFQNQMLQFQFDWQSILRFCVCVCDCLIRLKTKKIPFVTSERIICESDDGLHRIQMDMMSNDLVFYEFCNTNLYELDLFRFFQ